MKWLIVVPLVMMAAGCQALGTADAGAGTTTHNWSGGMFAAEDVSLQSLEVNLMLPDMSGWTPEQIAALAYPFAELFVSRNEVNIGTEQASSGGGDNATQSGITIAVMPGGISCLRRSKNLSGGHGSIRHSKSFL